MKQKIQLMFLVIALILLSGFSYSLKSQNWKNLIAPEKAKEKTDPPKTTTTSTNVAPTPPVNQVTESKQHHNNTHHHSETHNLNNTNITHHHHHNHTSNQTLKNLPDNECAITYISQVLGRHAWSKDKNKTKEEHYKRFQDEVKKSDKCSTKKKNVCHKIGKYCDKLKKRYIEISEEPCTSPKAADKEKCQKLEQELDSLFIMTLEHLHAPIRDCHCEHSPKDIHLHSHMFLKHVSSLLSKEKENDERKVVSYRKKIQDALHSASPSPAEEQAELVNIALDLFEIADDYNRQTDNGNKKNGDFDPTLAAKKTKRMLANYIANHQEEKPSTEDIQIVNNSK
jgi:hypothetical protein